MGNTENSDDIKNLLIAIESSFNISPWLLVLYSYITHYEKSTRTTSIIRRYIIRRNFCHYFSTSSNCELSGIDSNFSSQLCVGNKCYGL